MAKFTVFVVIVLLCVFTVVQTAESALQSSSLQSAKVLGTQTTRSLLLQSLNKSMALEGFFFDGSIPILVQDMKFVQADAPIPPDKYVPLTGTIPPSVKSGAKVRLSGTLQKPTSGNLVGEGIALQVSGTPSILQQPPAAMTYQSAALVAAAAAATSGPKKYAILIGGGKNYANNWFRYYNDLKYTYNLLRSKGYPAANIVVAWAWGPAPAVPGSWGPVIPINQPASTAGISWCFGNIASRCTAADSVFIMVVGQSSLYGDPVAIPGYWTWQNTLMNHTAFATQVNRILHYSRMTICLNQSYSGVFIPSLTRPNRIIVTSAASNKTASAHVSYAHSNFPYWFLSALYGHHLIGGTPAMADFVPADGKISIGEAYNYTLGKPGLESINSQLPQLEGNGVAPSHFGFAQSTGEGSLSLDTYL